MRFGTFGLLVLCASAFGQAPVISEGGIVNAASNAAGQALAAGSLVTIYGTGLAASTASAASVPLPTELGGVRVTFNGIPAPLLLVSAGQINGQVPVDVLPAGVTSGPATVIVTRGQESSAPRTAQVGPFSPGIFTVNFGVGQAIAINPDSTLAAAAGSIPGLSTHPANVNDIILLLGTGLGAVDPPILSGRNSLEEVRRNTTPPQVFIGGQEATVPFSGLSPQFVGVNQINVRIPAGVAAGDRVPIQLRQGNTLTTDQATIAIAGSGLTGQISLRSFVALSARPNSLALSGNIAYACTAEDINVVSVADPSNLRVSSTFAATHFNSANSIQCRIANNRLHVVNDTGNSTVTGTTPSISIYDLANATNPPLINATVTNKRFNGPPVFQDNFLLVPTNAIMFTNVITAQRGDVYSLNVSNPSAPAVAGTMFRAPEFTVHPQEGGPFTVFGVSRVNANTMLAGSSTSTGGDTSVGVGRLIVLDTGNPAQPTIAGELQIPGTRSAVAPVVEGTTGVGLAYIEGWRNPVNFPQGALVGPVMLYVANLANPRSPALVRTVFTPLLPAFTGGGGVSLGNGIFLLAGARDGTQNVIIKLDATNPQNPQFTTTNVPGPVMDMVRTGNLLYVLFESNQMAVYDIR